MLVLPALHTLLSPFLGARRLVLNGCSIGLKYDGVTYSSPAKASVNDNVI